jgi:hypothetical protein
MNTKYILNTLKSLRWCKRHGLTRMTTLSSKGKNESRCIKCVAESMLSPVRCGGKDYVWQGIESEKIISNIL